MRVLFAVHGYKPAYRLGGPIISVGRLAEKLVERGVDVTVFATDSNLDQTLDVETDVEHIVDGVRVWYFKRSSMLRKALPVVPQVGKSLGYLYAPAMANKLEELVPRMDIVHTHVPFIYPTYAAGRAAIRHRVPLVYHQRGVFDPERLRYRGWKKNLYLRFFELSVARRAHKLIALTETEVATYRELGLTNPIEIIPNGIDLPESPADTQTSVPGIPVGLPYVLFLSRIHPIKGVTVLAQAFARIQSRHPTTQLVIAGPDELGMKRQLLDIAARGGYGNRIHFPGMLTGSVKQAALRRAAVFCLPSFAEGFSMAVLEALSVGAPVVVSPGCNFPELEHARGGVICHAEPASLADALDQLLSDQASAAEMATRGRRLVASEYTWDVIADRVLHLYSGIAPRGSKLEAV